jgi:ComF family protein
MRILGDLLELLLPERCVGCGEAPLLLCDACAQPLRGPARPASTAPDGLPPPWTVAAYEGPLRKILSAYKEHGRTALAVPLGEALATALHAALTGLDPPHTIVWVPSRRATTRRRGHDPLRELVAVALQRLHEGGVRAKGLNALRHQKRVKDQAGLTAAQRTTNLHNALQARIDLPARPVILVDDVITTGASLTEAARALHAAGAKVTATATIATTPRHHP